MLIFIPEQIRLLRGDFFFRDAPTSTMPVLEVAARLQNRLTKIHSFRNGNCRHARLITDMFFYSREHPLPEWPQIHLLFQGHQIRERYINAMKQADQGEFSALIQSLKVVFLQHPEEFVLKIFTSLGVVPSWSFL